MRGRPGTENPFPAVSSATCLRRVKHWSRPKLLYITITLLPANASLLQIRTYAGSCPAPNNPAPVAAPETCSQALHVTYMTTLPESHAASNNLELIKAILPELAIKKSKPPKGEAVELAEPPARQRARQDPPKSMLHREAAPAPNRPEPVEAPGAQHHRYHSMHRLLVMLMHRLEMEGPPSARPPAKGEAAEPEEPPATVADMADMLL